MNAIAVFVAHALLIAGLGGRTMRSRSHAAWALPALLALACGEAASADSAGAPTPAEAPGGSSGGGAVGAAAPTTPPAEKEVESDYEAPVATADFVWIANPKSGRVALVDAKTLQVRTVEAGNGPTYLGSVPGQASDTALVLNVLSNDATLLRVTPTGLESKTFAVAPKANTLAFSADGRFAIAWTDARKVGSAPRTEGFQDLTVLDLVTGKSTILAVGYRPVAVGFASTGATAHAVTQDGIAIVGLDGDPHLTKNVAISDTPNEDPGSRDVAVTPNGQIALIRRDESPAITAVNLDTGVRTTVTLPGPVTDLDLVDKGDRAVAVVRSTSQAVVLPIPGIVGAPATFTTVTATGETIGSVSLSPSGAKGLLYTNASAAERVTVLDLAIDPPALRTVRLYSPVLAVFSAPDAGHALVLHDKVVGTAGAFSLVPVGNALPAKIVSMQARPAAVAITNDRAIVSERDDAAKVFGAYIARLPQLMVERYVLASPPIAVGVVPSAKRAFIAQKHPDGRLTFVDLDSGQARTLTGFELSARVVDGSKP